MYKSERPQQKARFKQLPMRDSVDFAIRDQRCGTFEGKERACDKTDRFTQHCICSPCEEFSLSFEYSSTQVMVIALWCATHELTLHSRIHLLLDDRV